MCRTGVQVIVFGSFFVLVASVARGQSAAFIGGDQVTRMQLQQKAAAADERQRKMATDAARLVEMAQQLKTSVDKTNKDVLSVNVIKEAERIEKLAREVREGMRQ